MENGWIAISVKLPAWAFVAMLSAISIGFIVSYGCLNVGNAQDLTLGFHYFLNIHAIKCVILYLLCKNNKYFQISQDKVQYRILIYNILYFY